MKNLFNMTLATKQWFNKYLLTILLHCSFWAGLFGIYYMSFSGFMEESHAFTRAITMVILLSSVFYLNTQVLINLFLEKQQYTKYITGLILVIAISIYIKLKIDIELKETKLPVISLERPYVLAFLPILFCIVFGTLVQMLINRNKREKKHIIQIKELSLAQTQFLKNQINPHFLFNNLNNIYSLVITNSPQAPQLILKLSDLLRYVIYKSNENKVSVMDELEQIKNMIALFQLKEDETINVKLNEKHLLFDAYIEPMILIPLIENCFKHWDSAINTNAYIAIEIHSSPDLFVFITENSAVDKHEINTSKTGGVGLENITKRLALAYGHDAIFSTERNENVFKAKLQIRWRNQ